MICGLPRLRQCYDEVITNRLQPSDICVTYYLGEARKFGYANPLFRYLKQPALHFFTRVYFRFSLHFSMKAIWIGQLGLA
jgi:hypothetical protein